MHSSHGHNTQVKCITCYLQTGLLYHSIVQSVSRHRLYCMYMWEGIVSFSADAVDNSCIVPLKRNSNLVLLKAYS